MNDITLLELAERYISGEMTTDERSYFEQLRRDNPEIDQVVVEHTIFLHNINAASEKKALQHTLNEVHSKLKSEGKLDAIERKGKVVHLWNRYKRVAAIAASIAGITALTFSGLVVTLSPKAGNKKELTDLSRKFDKLQHETNVYKNEVNKIKKKIDPASFTSGGTGFLIDGKGYLITNHHVVDNAKNIAVQNSKGEFFNAIIVYSDNAKDVAILKIEDENFKSYKTVPYTFSKNTSDLSQPVFMLGFPRNEIVYGEGYLSAKTGYNGDTITCQIAIPANPGNSGSPVFNTTGEVVGILSTRQTAADGVAFAINSKYIYNVINDLRKDTAYQNVKLPLTSSVKGMSRVQQVKKLEEYVYLVKIN